MKTLFFSLLIASVTTTYVKGQGFAQRGRGPGVPPVAILMALDSNQDGKISAAEIKNATAALKTLDKNGDGKLTSEEMGWPPNFGRGGRGGPGFGPGRGGRGEVLPDHSAPILKSETNFFPSLSSKPR